MPLTRQQAADLVQDHTHSHAHSQPQGFVSQQQLVDSSQMPFDGQHSGSPAWPQAHDGLDLYQHSQQQQQQHRLQQHHPHVQQTPRQDVFVSPMGSQTDMPAMPNFGTSANNDGGSAFYGEMNAHPATASPHDVMGHGNSAIHMTPSPGHELGQQPPHSAGAALGLGLTSNGRQLPPAHHRHSSLGQMGALAQAQRQSPYTPMRMGPSSPLPGVAPGRITRTGTTPNMANMAIFTNSSAFAQSVRSSSPGGTSSAGASTSFNSPVSFTGAQGFSPVGSSTATSDSMRYVSGGTSSSMDSRDTSMDSFNDSRASSLSASLSEEWLSVDSRGVAKSSGKKKVKLLNIDRKRICEQHEANPKLKQEDLANLFGVERSTVSKVLKDKERWLAVEEGSVDSKIVKHRQARFPELERQLSMWAHSAQAAGQTLTDTSIKNRALEIAKAIGGPTEKFKASGGWVDKFRTRSGLRKQIPGSSSQEMIMSSPFDGAPTSSLPSTLSSTFSSTAPDYIMPRFCHSMPTTSHGRLEAAPMPPATMAAMPTVRPASPPMDSSNNAMLSSDSDIAMGIRTTPTSKQKRHYDAIAPDQRTAAAAASSSLSSFDHDHDSQNSGGSIGYEMHHESKRRRGSVNNEDDGNGLGSPFPEMVRASRQQQHHQQHRQHGLGGAGSQEGLAARFMGASADFPSSSTEHPVAPGVGGSIEQHHLQQHHGQGWRPSPTSPLRPLRLSDLGRSNTSPGFGHQQGSVARKASNSGIGDDSGFGDMSHESLLASSGLDPSTSSQAMQHTRSLGSGGAVGAVAEGSRRMSPRSTAIRRMMLETNTRTDAGDPGSAGSPQSRSPATRILDGSGHAHSSSIGSSHASGGSGGGGGHSGLDGEDAVSLDQARQSLDVVLQFLNESENDIIPRSHFLTLGSLHGSLAAAAEHRGPLPMAMQVMQASQQQHQQGHQLQGQPYAQPHEHHQQQQQHHHR